MCSIKTEESPMKVWGLQCIGAPLFPETIGLFDFSAIGIAWPVWNMTPTCWATEGCSSKKKEITLPNQETFPRQ